MSKIKGDQTPAPFNILSGVLVQALTSPLKLADHGEQFVQFTSCFIAPWFTFHFVIISLLCMFGTQECYSSQTNAGIRYRDNDGLRLFFFFSPRLIWRLQTGSGEILSSSASAPSRLIAICTSTCSLTLSSSLSHEFSLWDPTNHNLASFCDVQSVMPSFSTFLLHHTASLFCHAE